jgi:hypothetical protein
MFSLRFARLWRDGLVRGSPHLLRNVDPERRVRWTDPAHVIVR